MGVIVSVDPDLCIGSGDCTRSAPRAFRLDETLDVAVVLDGAAEIDGDLLVRAAVECPTQAIRLELADGGPLLRQGAS